MGERTTSGLAKLGGEVIIRITVCPLTVGDYPNCVQLTPQLRQAAGTLAARRAKPSSREYLEKKVQTDNAAN